MSEEEIEILKDFLELKEIHSNNSVTKSYLSIYQETVKKLYATCENQQKEIEELKKKTKKCEYYEMVADELSKEIEELKEKNKKLRDKGRELIFEKQELTSALLDSIPEDKIKAKIKEYKKQIEELKDSQIFTQTEYEGAINVLQSLLEKE